jgi:hypothetical protein
MTGVVIIEPRVTGTWTMTVQLDGVVIHQRSGIPSRDEARARAAVWTRECGYRLRVRKGLQTQPGGYR